ncbi:MAG: cysteine desulfurase family protein [Atopococcus tabaci]|uniref:Cysteine desulfurase family protein n=1 Tax=Atopococcus tabaci TaxID=269774 RepID=A0AA43UCG3_9LACT|nr:cysteine desulfurase family protein [Atopococcus tabaci]
MIYFDNSATTHIYSEALETYQVVSNKYFGNPSSLHQLGESSSQLLTQSRNQIAEFFHVSSQEIFFTSGGTEGNNWAIKGTAFEKMTAGKHLITSAVEHPSVKKTFEQLENMGFETTYLSVDNQGRVNLEELAQSIRPDTSLVSIMAVNNEVGSVQPIEEIGKILQDYPQVHFHVDAVQVPGMVELDLSDNSRIDLATFSGHKFHGPRGIGFLYKNMNRRIQPLLTGGNQEKGQRSGTENVPAIAAMAKALRIRFDDADQKVKNIADLRETLRCQVDRYEHVKVFSPIQGAPHILCFGIAGIRGEVLVHALEEQDIYVSTTSACSSKKKTESSTLSAMKVDSRLSESAIRVSLSETNTLEEVDSFIQAFDEIYTDFQAVFKSKGD